MPLGNNGLEVFLLEIIKGGVDDSLLLSQLTRLSRDLLTR